MTGRLLGPSFGEYRLSIGFRVSKKPFVNIIQGARVQGLGRRADGWGHWVWGVGSRISRVWG